MNNEEQKQDPVSPEETTETPSAENETTGSENTGELAAERDKFMRLYAEFENYKRRTSKEKYDLMLTASKDIIVQLLPVIDDMERAFKMLDSQSEEVKKELEGFKLIHKKFFGTLESKGLKPIESISKPFDVELHEAVTKIPAPAEDLKGKVIDEVEKGYTLNDVVIRYAKVVVGE